LQLGHGATRSDEHESAAGLNTCQTCVSHDSKSAASATKLTPAMNDKGIGLPETVFLATASSLQSSMRSQLFVFRATIAKTTELFDEGTHICLIRQNTKAQTGEPWFSSVYR
jgi:hypothetical protein